jgi:environmental stress-induced protein Ves
MNGLWKHLVPADYAVSAWSGGVTTQLAIAPESARYADRAFLWRVSSATVELEESDFTPLPDYRRLIAPLEGEIRLRHGDGAPILLRPFAVHAFDGADATHAVGRCRDFNLMLRKGRAEGEMEALPLDGGGRELPGDPRGGEQLLFCVRGRCRVESGGDGALLQPGESLLSSGDRALRLLPGPEGAALMRCRMRRCEKHFGFSPSDNHDNDDRKEGAL